MITNTYSNHVKKIKKNLPFLSSFEGRRKQETNPLWYYEFFSYHMRGLMAKKINKHVVIQPLTNLFREMLTVTGKFSLKIIYYEV